MPVGSIRAGIVAPDLRVRGGVTETALFVARTLRDRLGADVRLLSLATTSVDASSRLLRRPGTWTRPGCSSYQHEEWTVEHAGAAAAEIEVARYWPRRWLYERLAGCDVLHVVAGTPAWAWAVRGFHGPLIVHFASFARHERASRPAIPRSPVEAWRGLMTRGVTVLEKAALRRADVVITLNETRRREAEAVAGGGRHFATVHVGVDTRRFAPGRDEGEGYLLTVGRLGDARKNIPLLLRAYAAARARSSRLPRLVLAGHSRPDGACWRLIAALGLRDSVEDRGPLDRHQLAALYRGASAFVLTSDEEGQGIVVLEAMASGLPIVTTACIGPQELVADGREGYVVPVRAIGPLADAMIRLSEDRALRQRMSAAARARAVREFSLDAAGARLCDVYRAAGLVPELQRSAAAAWIAAPQHPDAVTTRA